VCKLARRLPVASDRGFELVLAHLGAAFDAQALRLVVELLLRGFATDHWQMPPFVRGHSTRSRGAGSQTSGMRTVVRDISRLGTRQVHPRRSAAQPLGG